MNEANSWLNIMLLINKVSVDRKTVTSIIWLLETKTIKGEQELEDKIQLSYTTVQIIVSSYFTYFFYYIAIDWCTKRFLHL